MESLNNTEWDVLISGTGLPRSLLALALSRSGKKVLHVDRNDYYGGAEAALSLQEAKKWVNDIQIGGSSTISDAVIEKPEHPLADSSTNNSRPKLGFSRAYSISLSPQIIYTRSNLLPSLVSSKIYRQLEFLAVGSWWLYTSDEPSSQSRNNIKSPLTGKLYKIPSSREDVYKDTSIPPRKKRSLMQFLKLAANAENHSLVLEEWGQKPFLELLSTKYKLESRFQELLLTLTLSTDPPQTISTAYALQQIHRHLTSIGMFGPGFCAVIPKWGGLAEVAQVACRAQAVGGGVYVLNKGIHSISSPTETEPEAPSTSNQTPLSTVQLESGDENVRARWIITSQQPPPSLSSPSNAVHHLIAIIASPLPSLFSAPSEGSPPPAATIVSFPSHQPDTPYIYLTVHSSDTGECADGQCTSLSFISSTSPPTLAL
ncbi:MAG: hypothetical protein Q9190_003234 [Brigantiaea leucoxantha]